MTIIPSKIHRKKLDFKKYVQELARACLAQIQHEEYDMTIKWEEGVDDGIAAEIAVDGKYLFFTLKIYAATKRAFDAKDYRYVCQIIMHEICHLLTEPLYLLSWRDSRPSEERIIDETRERQTQRICYAIMKGISADFYSPKRLLGK